MPPVLDPSKSKVDGLAFLGLSLSRHHHDTIPSSHPASATHQTAFDLNLVQDREYKYISATNDDGWLVGGGEYGPPHSYKLAAPDSSHVEIIRIGTYRPEWGGVDREEIVKSLQSGEIRIPQITALPTGVIANPDKPPELEIRFDMVERSTKDGAVVIGPPKLTKEAILDPATPLPINWELRFLHNQFFYRFQNPSRFCPGPHHSTFLRKADFRSPEARDEFFGKHCAAALKYWHEEVGPQPLVADPNRDTPGIQRVLCQTAPDDKVEDLEALQKEYTSGVYLFTDRQNITHHFSPNFFPPYDTAEKRAIIWEVLKEEWDEPTLAWKPV